MHLAGVIADHDKRVLANVTENVVAGVGNLRFVRQEHPGAREYAPKLELVNVGVVVDAQWDEPALEVHAVQDAARSRRELGIVQGQQSRPIIATGRMRRSAWAGRCGRGWPGAWPA